MAIASGSYRTLLRWNQKRRCFSCDGSSSLRGERSGISVIVGFSLVVVLWSEEGLSCREDDEVVVVVAVPCLNARAAAAARAVRTVLMVYILAEVYIRREIE